jgi:hypothetical protein
MQLKKNRKTTKNFIRLAKPKELVWSCKDVKEDMELLRMKCREVKAFISHTVTRRRALLDLFTRCIRVLDDLTKARMVEIERERQILQELRNQSWFRELFKGISTD